MLSFLPFIISDFSCTEPSINRRPNAHFTISVTVTTTGFYMTNCKNIDILCCSIFVFNNEDKAMGTSKKLDAGEHTGDLCFEADVQERS